MMKVTGGDASAAAKMIHGGAVGILSGGISNVSEIRSELANKWIK